MKIRMTQAGWDNFTGYFGVVEFRDGLSVNEVSDMEAQRIAAVISVNREDGTNPSAAQLINDTRAQPMEVVSTPRGDADAPAGTPVKYTAEQLAEIADKQGIAGLRVIAKSLDVAGKSIAELIGKILAVAGEKPAEVQAEVPVATPDAPVEQPAQAD